MASDFTLQIICRIHQIRYSKRSLFGAKSQTNDAIGYATLIAPEITSGIKPRMYGSVFSAHVGRYCLENHSLNTAMNASVNAYTTESRVLLQ